MPESEKNSGWQAAIATALRSFILFVTALALYLAAAEAVGLSPGQTTSWILVAYGLPGLFGLALAYFYRIPLLETGNIFSVIFIITLGSEFTFGEIIGAFIVTGGAVVVISLFGLTARLARVLPPAIVFALLAGAVTPFVSGIFTQMGEAPLVVGGALVAYFLSARFLQDRVPPIITAVVAAFLLAAFTGQISAPAQPIAFPTPAFSAPVFSLTALGTIVPVLLVLITVQSNLPSIVFLREQGYKPPEKMLDMVSGFGTVLVSFFGPTAVSLSLPATSLNAGPEAGPKPLRFRSVFLSSLGLVLVGLMAGAAAILPQMVSNSLLLALAGFAVVGVLTGALQQMVRGPLILGPVFTFAISLSDISFLGFGPFFWSLVIGTAISFLLERRAGDSST